MAGLGGGGTVQQAMSPLGAAQIAAGGPQQLFPQLPPPGQVGPTDMRGKDDASSSPMDSMGMFRSIAPGMMGSMQEGNFNPLIQQLIMRALSGGM